MSILYWIIQIEIYFKTYKELSGSPIKYKLLSLVRLCPIGCKCNIWKLLGFYKFNGLIIDKAFHLSIIGTFFKRQGYLTPYMLHFSDVITLFAYLISIFSLCLDPTNSTLKRKILIDYDVWGSAFQEQIICS